ncbi:MAG: fucose isomerase [bacterium]|nr:fucose isomerase [bacterium]
MKRTMTYGVIVGNRGFFPAVLCKEGRERLLAVLAKRGERAIILDTSATRAHGAIENLAEARACAAQLRAHREELDGVIVTLPNFGDERAIANALREADLALPVLVHAYADEVGKMSSADRRDSFCGKISVCNNLHQYGIKFTLTRRHTCAPESEEFAADLDMFGAVCRVVRRLRRVRVGAIGARPGPFNTVRYSEKLLERAGVSVVTLDLSEICGRSERLSDRDRRVRAKLREVREYVSTRGVPRDAVLKMAKLGVVVEEFMKEEDLAGTAIQCWTALEEYFGVVPCTVMSLMSEKLLPSACEVDVGGLVSMLAVQEACEGPAALVDWNNNYGNDANACVVFHCSNMPKSMLADVRMDHQAIIAGTVGKAKSYGTVVGQMVAGPITFCRVSTDDGKGRVVSYVGHGEVTDERVTTFGGYGVMRIRRLQSLLQFICQRGFEHHVAVGRGKVASALAEAFGNYLGWDVYQHEAE